jgi:hypothetical protein
MKAWNFTVGLENRPGELARVTEAFGEAGINIEGFCSFVHDNRGWVQILVTDESAAKRVFDKLGLKIERSHEVLVEQLSNKPGVLGEMTRRLADSGINLTTAYIAADTRVVLGADDMTTLRKAWESVPATARR